MHIHISAVGILTTFAGVLIAGTIWRLIASHLSNTQLGQAMSFMY